MSIYNSLMSGLMLFTIIFGGISCFFAVGKVFAGRISYVAFVICFGLVAVSVSLYWFCLPKKEEQFIPDQLEYEPTYDQILAMPLKEQHELVMNARMKEGCKPDDWGNRAKVRACYLINEAYKTQDKLSAESGDQP